MAKESSLKSLKTGDFVVLMVPRVFVGVYKFMGCRVEVVTRVGGAISPIRGEELQRQQHDNFHTAACAPVWPLSSRLRGGLDAG